MVTTPAPPAWAPTAQQLKDEMRGRVSVRDGKITDPALVALITDEASALLAELPDGVEGQPDFIRAQPVARLFVLFRAAARLEDTLHPEQATQPDSNAQRLQERSEFERDRLFRLLNITSSAAGDDAGPRGGAPLAAFPPVGTPDQCVSPYTGAYRWPEW